MLCTLYLFPLPVVYSCKGFFTSIETRITPLGSFVFSIKLMKSVVSLR